jgi:hypothetical protein
MSAEHRLDFENESVELTYPQETLFACSKSFTPYSCGSEIPSARPRFKSSQPIPPQTIHTHQLRLAHSGTRHGNSTPVSAPPSACLQIRIGSRLGEYTSVTAIRRSHCRGSVWHQPGNQALTASSQRSCISLWPLMIVPRYSTYTFVA